MNLDDILRMMESDDEPPKMSDEEIMDIALDAAKDDHRSVEEVHTHLKSKEYWSLEELQSIAMWCAKNSVEGQAKLEKQGIEHIADRLAKIMLAMAMVNEAPECDLLTAAATQQPAMVASMLYTLVCMFANVVDTQPKPQGGTE